MSEEVRLWLVRALGPGIATRFQYNFPDNMAAVLKMSEGALKATGLPAHNVRSLVYWYLQNTTRAQEMKDGKLSANALGHLKQQCAPAAGQRHVTKQLSDEEATKQVLKELNEDQATKVAQEMQRIKSQVDDHVSKQAFTDATQFDDAVRIWVNMVGHLYASVRRWGAIDSDIGRFLVKQARTNFALPLTLLQYEPVLVHLKTCWTKTVQDASDKQSELRTAHVRHFERVSNGATDERRREFRAWIDTWQPLPALTASN